MEEKLHKEKEAKEAEKIKSAEKEEPNEIKMMKNEQEEISVVTEKVLNAGKPPLESPPLYDVNSPRFPSSESKNNIQPSFSTDTHVPYQKSSAEYQDPDRYRQEHELFQQEPEETVNQSYTPGPIRLPTAEVEEENFITVSDLPPIPDTIVEQERLEMIEIKNDGTSGHLSHSLS